MQYLGRGQAVLASIGLMLMLLVACGKQSDNEPGSVKFGTFSQSITSPTKTLELAANQQVPLSVTIENLSTYVWYASGTYPINISYKWIKGEQVLPIEGLRTHIPKPEIKPGDSVRADITVLAPADPGTYELDVTLVQEGVAWFSLSGATPLKIPVVVHPKT